MLPAHCQTPWWIRDIQRNILGFFQLFLLIFYQLLPIVREIFHQKVLGCIYSSRHVYLAKYGIEYIWHVKSQIFVCSAELVLWNDFVSVAAAGIFHVIFTFCSKVEPQNKKDNMKNPDSAHIQWQCQGSITLPTLMASANHHTEFIERENMTANHFKRFASVHTNITTSILIHKLTESK